MMKTSLSSLHKCDKCELNFLSKEGMEKHCARVHTEASEAKFNCDQCEDIFKSKSDMTKHRAAARTVGGCVVCQKSGANPKFSNICEVTKHRKNHERKKISNENANGKIKSQEDREIKIKRKGSRMRNYAEDSSTQLNVEGQISKISNVKKDLKELNEKEVNKKNKHSNELVVQGDNRKKPKLGIQILESRSKIVTIERIPDTGSKISPTEENAKEMSKSDALICNSCPKSFPTGQSLTMHMNIHLDEKPFNCIKCEKTFAQKGNLRVHMYRNHGFIQEQKDPENIEEELIDKADSKTSPVVVEEKIVGKVENGRTTSIQRATTFPQVGVALLRQTTFHYPTFSWAQLVQKGIVGVEANFMPPEVEDEVEVEKEMEVEEERISAQLAFALPPDSSAGQQVIGF